MQIKFTAYGTPKTAGSKTSFSGVRRDGTRFTNTVDSCKGGKSFRHVVVSAAREAYDGPLLSGALSVAMTFYFVRTKSDFTSKGKLKKGQNGFHTKLPDVLKSARLVEDALSKVIYLDDKQIVQESLQKAYGEPARVEVTINTLDEPRDQ
jgi:Holliday junction resolvase RusA-like endonuclease